MLVFCTPSLMMILSFNQADSTTEVLNARILMHELDQSRMELQLTSCQPAHEEQPAETLPADRPPADDGQPPAKRRKKPAPESWQQNVRKRGRETGEAYASANMDANGTLRKEGKWSHVVLYLQKHGVTQMCRLYRGQQKGPSRKHLEGHGVGWAASVCQYHGGCCTRKVRRDHCRLGLV